MYKRTPLEKRLYQRPSGTVWHCWAYDYAGKRYTASTHQTDRKAALEAARKIERDKSVPPSDPASHVAQTFTLAQALDLLEKHDVRANAAVNTVRFHEDRGRHLIRLLGADTPVAALTLPALNEYTDKRLVEKANRHTIQKEHRVLRHALALAKKDGKYFGDPKALTVEGFDKAKGTRGFYRPGDRWLERVEHIEALLAHTSSNPDRHRVDRRDDVLAIVNLGLRRRELLVICPEHVDRRNAVVQLRALKQGGTITRSLKTEGSTRPLPLNTVMLAMFERRMRNARAGAPLFTDWGSGNRDLKANWKRARASLLEHAPTKEARADLDATLPESLTFNDLRRTFCSQMKNAGVSFEDCAELLGHEDIAMVRRVYGKTALDTLHAAVAKLPAMTLPPQALPRPKKLSRRERQRGGMQSKGAATVLATNPMRKPGSEGAG